VTAILDSVHSLSVTPPGAVMAARITHSFRELALLSLFRSTRFLYVVAQSNWRSLGLWLYK